MSRSDLDELRQDIQGLYDAEYNVPDELAARTSRVLLTVLNVLKNLADENAALEQRLAKLERR